MAEKLYACIKNNIVVNVIVCDDPSEDLLNSLKVTQEVDEIVEATVNTIMGGTYDGYKFWLPQPYESWVKNQELNKWEAPIPHPDFDEESPKYYIWNEDILNWEEIQASE